MIFYISPKTKTTDNENNPDSYLKRFYFDHRILHFTPKQPGNPRISQIVQFPGEKYSLQYGSFECIPVKSLVIPYGKIVLVMTQTVNFFKGEVKDKLSYKIEEVDEKLEVINNCKSPLHLQSSSPSYSIKIQSSENEYYEDNKNDKSLFYPNNDSFSENNINTNPVQIKEEITDDQDNVSFFIIIIIILVI